MAKIQYNPTEIELINLVKAKLANESITYIRKYSHELKNFTDRRNHKFWALYNGSSMGQLFNLVNELNQKVQLITKDYKVVLCIPKYEWDATNIKIVYTHKK